MRKSSARALRAVMLVLFCVVAMIGLPFAWLLKDGLGPGAVASSGLDAIGRWLMTFYIGPILGLMMLGLIGTWVMMQGAEDE